MRGITQKERAQLRQSQAKYHNITHVYTEEYEEINEGPKEKSFIQAYDKTGIYTK